MASAPALPARAAAVLVTAAAFAVLLWPVAASAQVAGLALRGLQPGGARAGDALPDAFRSPFDDRDGWWSLARTLAATEARLEYTKDEPVSPRLTGGEGYAHDRRLQGEVAAPLAFLPGRWWGRLGYENQDLNTEVDASKGGTTLSGSGEMVGAALRYHLPGPGLTLQASLPLWHRGNLDRRVAGAGVRLEPAPELSLQVAHTRLLSDVAFYGEVLDEPVPFELNLAENTWNAAVRLAPRPWLVAEGSWREGSYEPQEEVTEAARYEITPAGMSRLRGVTFRLQPWRRHELLLRFQELDFDLEAGMHWGGQQFGRLTYARGYQRSRLVAWRWQLAAATTSRLEFEDVWLDTEARIRMESWPFTDTVIDLLGVRQIVRGELDASWQRWTGIMEFGALGGRWRAGASWFRVRPRATLVSFRYAFLLFGQADKRHDELQVEQLDLISLLLETSLPLGPVDLNLSLQQFLYGEAAERPQPPAPGVPPPPAAPPAKVDGWWGGTYLKAGLAYRFG